MPKDASSCRVTRVSSHASIAHFLSVSRTRGLASDRLPIGVATIWSVPALLCAGAVNGKAAAAVKTAMNRAGARAEDLCAALLRRAGLTLVERNWRCRHGEIDLIAEEGETVVFAEVRMRTGHG